MSDWKKHILNLNSPIESKEVGETFDAMFDAIKSSGVRSITMTEFQPDLVNPRHLIIALRASYQWRNEIYGWREALHVARQSLILSNGDLSLLDGL